MPTRRVTATIGLALAAALALAACGDDSGSSATTAKPADTTAKPADTTAKPADTTAAATTAKPADTTAAATTAGGATTSAGGGSGTLDTNLKGACPDTVIVQTDWNPEAEHGQLYELVGPGYTVDTNKKTVTGPLTIDGVDTGVKIQVRVGGPAIGFQTVTSQLYQDRDIMLGYVSTDEAIQNSVKFPTKAVVAPFNINPQIIMWDPATYPNVKAIKDLKATGAKVRYFQGAAYMDYLIQSGQLDKAQTDGSYDGTPTNFIADGGKSAQQGFASAEPYFYQYVLKEKWGKPVAFQLINDAGWTAYAQSLATRAGDFDKYKDCFKKLVPIIQKAQANYIADPAAANKLIVDLVKQYNTGWEYTADQADASVKAQKEYKLVANSPDGTLGSFDLDRVKKFIEVATPIYTASGSTPKSGLTAADLVTNEFIQKNISLSS